MTSAPALQNVLTWSSFLCSTYLDIFLCTIPSFKVKPSPIAKASIATGFLIQLPTVLLGSISSFKIFQWNSRFSFKYLFWFWYHHNCFGSGHVTTVFTAELFDSMNFKFVLLKRSVNHKLTKGLVINQPGKPNGNSKTVTAKSRISLS